MTRGEALQKIQDKYPNAPITSTAVGAAGVLDILEIMGLVDFSEKPAKEKEETKPAKEKAVKNEG